MSKKILMMVLVCVLAWIEVVRCIKDVKKLRIERKIKKEEYDRVINEGKEELKRHEMKMERLLGEKEIMKKESKERMDEFKEKMKVFERINAKFDELHNYDDFKSASEEDQLRMLDEDNKVLKEVEKELYNAGVIKERLQFSDFEEFKQVISDKNAKLRLG